MQALREFFEGRAKKEAPAPFALDFFSIYCHARWHAVNDPLYNEEDYNEKPHAPVVAEEIELIANEAYWRTRR